LNRLGPERCDVDSLETSPPGCGSFAARADEALQVLLWHQVLPELPNQKVWSGRLALPIKQPGDYILVQSRIAVKQGSAWETWVELGQPQDLSHEEMRLLRAQAEPGYELFQFPGAGKTISVDFSVAPAEVYLFELRRKGTPALPKSALRSQLMQWEQQMGDASKA